MAKDRDEQENEPKVRVVDRRMLSEDERAGRGAATSAPDDRPAPKLEIIGGGAKAPSRQEEPPDEDSGSYAAPDDGEEPELTEEEAVQLQGQMEQEQFDAIEKQMGRPLTEQEKGKVREEMERQAATMAALEIPPLLQQLMAEMSARAAVHLGLMPNPYTRLIARNDTQARMAIDAFAAVLDVVKPHLDANSQREYARVLNDLRVNFVSITGSSTTGPSRIIH